MCGFISIKNLFPNVQISIFPFNQSSQKTSISTKLQIFSPRLTFNPPHYLFINSPLKIKRTSIIIRFFTFRLFAFFLSPFQTGNLIGKSRLKLFSLPPLRGKKVFFESNFCIRGLALVSIINLAIT